MEIDRGIGRNPPCRSAETPRAWRLLGVLGEDDIARRHLARFEHGLQPAPGWPRPTDRRPRPAMDAAVVAHAGEGSRLQLSVLANGSPSGWAKKMTLRPLPCPLKVATTLSRSSVSIARALANSPPSARRPACSARSHLQPARARRRRPALHRGLTSFGAPINACRKPTRISHSTSSPCLAGARLQARSCFSGHLMSGPEGPRPARHQIITRACLRFRYASGCRSCSRPDSPSGATSRPPSVSTARTGCSMDLKQLVRGLGDRRVGHQLGLVASSPRRPAPRRSRC